MNLQSLKSTMNTAEFLSRVGFHGKTGDWTRVDRALNAEGKWESGLTNINDALASEGVLMDLTNIKFGWLNFDGGVDIQVQHHSLPPTVQPSDRHKGGFLVEMWLGKSISQGDALREFSHTAGGVKDAMFDLLTAWQAGAENVDSAEREAGEIVPLIKIGVEPFSTKNGVFQKPVFTIAGWLPRPVEWGMPAPLGAAPAPPQLTVAPASPAGDADLPF